MYANNQHKQIIVFVQMVTYYPVPFAFAFYCLHVYEEEFEDRGNKNESINRRSKNIHIKLKTK